MENSVFIAKLIGPIVLVTGLVGLFNIKALQEIGRCFLANRALIFMGGIFALLAGLTIVNTHNVWVADWPVIITAVGWASLGGGVLRLACADLTISLGEKMIANTALLRVLGAVLAGLGAFLAYKGYL